MGGWQGIGGHATSASAVDRALDDVMAEGEIGFAGDERFGMKMSWGQFEGEHALALSAAGVLGRNLFSSHDRLAVDVGVAVGGRGNIGTRAGAQITW